MTNNKQTAVGIGIATYDNVEWVFQFNDDNPILISQPIGWEKELIIKLDNTSYSNIVFSDGKGNTFKIFAREQTQWATINNKQQWILSLNCAKNY